jgi:hypothetical protein
VCVKRREKKEKMSVCEKMKEKVIVVREEVKKKREREKSM